MSQLFSIQLYAFPCQDGPDYRIDALGDDAPKVVCLTVCLNFDYQAASRYHREKKDSHISIPQDTFGGWPYFRTRYKSHRATMSDSSILSEHRFLFALPPAPAFNPLSKPRNLTLDCSLVSPIILLRHVRIPLVRC